MTATPPRRPWLLGVLFMAAGAYHFVNPAFYVAIMPPYLPWHHALVLLSGVAEFVLGALVLVPHTQRLAAWGLIALLVAVFPANMHMVMHPELFPSIPVWALWARLPLQGVLIGYVYGMRKGPTTEARTTGAELRKR